VLGLVGSVFVFGVGLAYIENRRRAANKRGEGYGTELLNEPEPFEEKELPNPWIAMLPLVVLGVTNLILTFLVPRAYGAKHEVVLGGHSIVTQLGPVAAIWAVEGALLLGLATVFVSAWRPVLANSRMAARRRLPGLCLRRSIPRPSMGSVG
jgi:H+/gluconate symporter-like permease